MECRWEMINMLKLVMATHLLYLVIGCLYETKSRKALKKAVLLMHELWIPQIIIAKSYKFFYYLEL